MRFIILLFLSFVCLISCQSDPDEDAEQDGNKNHISVKLNPPKDVQSGEMDVNNPYNQLSLFIAGKDTRLFKDIQKQQYYLNYKNKLDESWNKVTAKNLESIDKWANANTNFVNDTITLFYPFSGPDFLYANAFFPKSQAQILVGLENPGKLPNLSKMDDTHISMYLYKLYHSLRYINQAGYFTTNQMQNDFDDSSMNGIIHIICFYLAKTNNHIANISAVQIDNFGDEKEKKNFEVADEFINGIKIDYFSVPLQEFKTLYYFPLDLSNENIEDQLGFLMFVNKFGLKNTFLKSASYILHDNNFSIIRDLILKQSKKIVQDDSGIPYGILLNSGYSVNLFGSYSRTIDVFKNHFQPDLKEALNKGKASKLPFKLGYNSWKNEMVLMIADQTGSTANKPITYKTEKEGVVFKVQIKSSWKKIPEDAVMFRGLPKVDYYFSDNLYKYTLGNFSSQLECEPYRQLAVRKGFKDAFLVAFYKKNRISLEEAEKIMASQ